MYTVRLCRAGGFVLAVPFTGSNDTQAVADPATLPQPNRPVTGSSVPLVWHAQGPSSSVLAPAHLFSATSNFPDELVVSLGTKIPSCR